MGIDQHTSGNNDKWDEAYRRVENYLQACGVAPRLVLTELAFNIIDRTRRRAVAEPSEEDSVALAMRELFKQMTAGFGRAIATDSATDPQLRARGRLALATSGATPQWTRLMFETTVEIEQLKSCFDDRPLQAGPELRLSKLPPAQIEYAFSDTDEDTASVPWRVPVTAMALALSLVGAMGAAWAVSH